MTDVLTLDFYTTLGCHLCELALDLMQQTLHPEDFVIHSIDIANDDELVEKFGEHIPVLRRCDTDQLLYWPFDRDALVQFLTD